MATKAELEQKIAGLEHDIIKLKEDIESAKEEAEENEENRAEAYAGYEKACEYINQIQEVIFEAKDWHMKKPEEAIDEINQIIRHYENDHELRSL